MTDEITLELVSARARLMAAQHLRSRAVAVARLRELIDAAHGLGHSHGAIHAALVAGGLTMGWNNYRVALARARKAGRTFDARAVGATGSVAEDGDADPRPNSLLSRSPSLPPPLRPSWPSPAGSTAAAGATPVLDALRRARDTSSRDYTRVARDSHRKEPRP